MILVCEVGIIYNGRAQSKFKLWTSGRIKTLKIIFAVINDIKLYKKNTWAYYRLALELIF